MIPGYVRDLEGYWLWIEGLCEASGGFFEGAGLLVVEPVSLDGDPPWFTLFVPRQRLHFYDGCYLSFEMVVSQDLEVLGYSFHYSRPDHDMAWRHDKHPGHETTDGRDTHVHLPGGKRLPEDEVGIEDVFEYVREDQASRAS